MDEDAYVLGYPNLEVKNSFLKHLLLSFSREMNGTESSKFKRLSKYLHREDYDAFFETVRSIFASIAYTLNARRNEAYFHTMFYLMVSASGMNVRSEVLTSKGRIDLVVEFSDKIYIMEFKCNQGAAAGLKQIHAKGYPERYARSGKKRILMGVDFNSEKRNLAEWKVETMES